MAVVNWAFVALSGPLGWVASVIAALGAVGVARLMAHSGFSGRKLWGVAILLMGFSASAALLTPAVLAGKTEKQTYRSQRGPFKVQQAILALPPLESGAGPAASIVTQIWFPAEADGKARTLTACSDLLTLPLAPSENPRRLILYMPHFAGARDDNAARLTYLASHGYVVAAFDDIARDPPKPGATPEDEKVRLQEWRFGSQAEYAETIALSDQRVKVQAEKALSGLDRLAACANSDADSPWTKTVDYNHAGFLGFSFGGATAAEAATMDKRVVAVANLDGSFFGQAFAKRLQAPYLYLISDYKFPSLETMMSKNPQDRYFWRLAARDLDEQARLAARPGSAGIQLKGSVHESFSDDVLKPRASKVWVTGNPGGLFAVANLYIRDFFEVNLQGKPAERLNDQPSKSPEALTFKDIGLAPGGGAYLLPPADAKDTKG